MGLGSKPLREIGKIEEHGRPQESVARMRPESFVRHLASRRAALAAFLMFLRAVAFSFVVAIADLLSLDAPDHRLTGGPRLQGSVTKSPSVRERDESASPPED